MVLATLPLGPDANVVRDLGVSGDRIRVRAEAGLVSDPVLVPVWPEAACRGSGLDWFPPHHDLRAEAAAINVCRTCPHQAECLAWAIEHDERGIWGGTTDRERLRVKSRGKRPIRHGTEAGAVEHRRQGVPTCDECAVARLAAERARRARRQSQGVDG